jgi:hypothetical protein
LLVHAFEPAQSEEAMKDFCRFLELDTSIHQRRCAAGINFVSVGQNRELCRICPLAELGDIPLCPNADVYVYLRRGAAETAEVEVKFACGVNDTSREEALCAGCPARSRDIVSPSMTMAGL